MSVSTSVGAPAHAGAAAPVVSASVNNQVTFESLRLREPVLRALRDEGYTVPTPIQAKAIPPVLAGRDVMGCAQTGTGKTAAFALPILHRLLDAPAHPSTSGKRNIRVLVLSPTRELAHQIADSFRAYGRHTTFRQSVIYGGIGQGPQVQALRSGVDILIATPGRLEDLMQQGHVDLRSVEVFVLDEGDQMLDMGFIHAIRRIVPKLPAKRQNLMFSATMPPEIRALANTILRNPESVQVAPVSAAADTVQQSVYFVEKRNKAALLTHYINNNAITRTLVFTRTKHGADRVAKHLTRSGIKAEAIHGNKSQNQRNRSLASFKSQRPPVLVATDVAARGLDIDEVSHVINFDVPNVPETYVHRIGRTGRAGASGVAVSFCDGEERDFIRQIERLTRRPIPVKSDHPDYPASAVVEGSDRGEQRERHQQPRQQRGGTRDAQQRARHPQREHHDRPQHRGGGQHSPSSSASGSATAAPKAVAPKPAAHAPAAPQRHPHPLHRRSQPGGGARRFGGGGGAGQKFGRRR